MPTFEDVIEEVLSNLQGYTAAPDQVTALMTGIDASETELMLMDAAQAGRGIIEIDQELMWVQMADRGTGMCTLLPLGRGWRGTTAVAHDADATVTISPAVPRSVVAREVNNQLNAMWPDIFGVSTIEFTYDDIVKFSWELPADCEAILDIRYKDQLNNWCRLRSWEYEASVNTTDFPSGKAIRLGNLSMDRTVQVVYAVKPVTLGPADDFADTGLSTGAKDLVVLGTLSRIAPAIDYARLGVVNASATEMGAVRPPNGGMALVKYLEAKYAQRLSQERAALAKQYPARIHFTR